MSKFAALRAALAAELADALPVPVYPLWPDTLDPPCAFVAPPLFGEYASRGPNFGEYTIALDVVLLVPHGDAGQALAALEALLETTLVNTADWTLTGIDSPAPTTVTEAGAEYLACVVHLSRPVPMK